MYKKQTLPLGKRVVSVAMSALMAVCFVPTAAFANTADQSDAERSQEAAATETQEQTTSDEELEALAAQLDEQGAAAPTIAQQQASAQATEVINYKCGNGWTLTFSVSGKTATVSGVSVTGSGKLTIPSSIAGVSVTAIGDDAFYSSTTLTALTEVSIPSTVTAIGAQAFRNTGLTSIEIPSSVTSIDKYAFRECSSLKTVKLHEGLETLGWGAFMKDTALTTINIPSTTDHIPLQCFWSCSSLANVTFDGDSIRYLNSFAFQKCTSLTEIDIPLLTESPTAAEAIAEGWNNFYANIAGYTIGYYCFSGCSSLSSVVLEGPVVEEPESYFASSCCLEGCGSDLQIVNLGARAQVSYGTATSRSYVSTEYCTLDYYMSYADAQNYTNKAASVTCMTQDLNTIEYGDYGDYTVTRPAKLIGLVNNPSTYKNYLYKTSATSAPTLPKGKTWVILNGPSSSYSSGNMGNSSFSYYNDQQFFTSSYRVVAADEGDLTSAWVENAKTRKYYADSTSTTAEGCPILALDSDGGSEDIDSLVVHQTNGKILDSSLYTLYFQKAELEVTRGFGGYYYTTVKQWDDIDKADISESGWYRVSASGVGDNASTKTDYLYFKLENPIPTGQTYYDSSSALTYMNTVTDNASRFMANDSSYNVLVNNSNWQAQMVAAALAGAGKSDSTNAGLVLLDYGAGTYTGMTTGQIISGAKKYIMVGSQDEVPQSAETATTQVYLSDFIRAKATDGGWRAGSSATDAQSLASSVMSEFKPANWGASWGTTAVVASSTMELASAAAMGYIYDNSTRLYFLDESGNISDADLTALSNSAIENIVLIGGTNCVSDAVATQIANKTGKTPTRMFSEDSAGTASLEYAKSAIEAKTAAAEAEGSEYEARIIVADATDPANCIAAAMYANTLNGVMVSVRTIADAKALRAYLEDYIQITEEGALSVDYLYAIGEFSFIDGDACTYFQQPWLANAVDRSLEVGDRFEVGGFIYQVASTEGSFTAEFVDATPGVDSEDVPSKVKYGSIAYEVIGETDFTATATTTPVELGETATFVCELDGVEEGEGADPEEGDSGIHLTYQWEYSLDGGDTWANATGAGNDTATLTEVADQTRVNAGCLFRCFVEASDGRTAETDPIGFEIKKADLSATASTTPVALNTTGELVCTVEGLGSATAAYQWYYRTSSTGSWSKATATGNATATLSASVTASRAKNEYKCVVTASDGRTAETDPIQFQVDESAALTATASTTPVALGATGELVCSVEGLGSATATYQWQYSTNGTKWTNATATGAKTATLSAAVTATRLKYLYRCVVTASDGRTATTGNVQFKVDESAALTATASTTPVALGATGKLVCAVEGLGSATAAYQWYYRTSSTGSWSKATATGNATATLSASVTASRAKNEYKCVVTASDGRTAETDPIQFSVL